ncbi:MAG: PBP1A family penicillin-binding protein [Bryobacteraceae bacterium]|nr:PBP1A family penicillin-binding protein [Bryobacteraceae bacterium]MDW8378484.1 PBP1A family penicillin-binding protein [Bryobacterales bacterium]
MAIRARVPRGALLTRFFLHPVGRILLALVALGFTVAASAFVYFYLKYARLIEEKLNAGPFSTTSMVFAAPRTYSLGEEATPEEIIASLRNSGYSESKATRMGSYTRRGDSLEIYPGPDSYFKQEAAVIRFQDGRISQIVSLRDNTERTQHTIEPELITNLFDRNREKRRLVRFQDIPKVLVNAVVAAEDKRFFMHAGFDPLRILKSAYVDLKAGYRAQGASTLSMQVARMFWLDQKKTYARKAAEVLITMELERRLTKEQIFEFYANQVDLGRRGTFAIRGFAEASLAYFGKDLSQLTLPEAATLAGHIQRPSYTNPFKWPERAKKRRNVVLMLMRENGFISDQEYAAAISAPLELNKGGVGSTDAPYFVDLVNDELQEKFADHDFQSRAYKVYTTLDMNLQREAVEAVRLGMKEVDQKLKNRRKADGSPAEAQVALVALDAHNGEVKALVGGRNYGLSQLNRVMAKRQPGSSFKPFVYAAALNTALYDPANPITASTQLVDEPTTFWFDGKPYEPHNHRNQYSGTVTVRQALAKSMNIPTVKLAEMVGYASVVQLARRSGLNLSIHPTPSVALGAYEVTPLEIAGAYTVFSNSGTWVKPSLIRSIRDDRGEVIYEARPTTRQALDPRVAYLMTNLMEEVIRSGTGAGVRSRGFLLPAAGKTGTSHDGWFAGFTTKLICVVWVGFDDNQELNLEGAQSALPIWAEFMKRAHQYREYAGARYFDAPDGIVSVEIDPVSGQLAGPGCPNTRSEVFIHGTQPQQLCRLHGGGATRVASWDTEDTPAPAVAPKVSKPLARSLSPSAASGEISASHSSPSAPVPNSDPAAPTKPKGFFGRIRDMLK